MVEIRKEKYSANLEMWEMNNYVPNSPTDYEQMVLIRVRDNIRSSVLPSGYADSQH